MKGPETEETVSSGSELQEEKGDAKNFVRR